MPDEKLTITLSAAGAAATQRGLQGAENAVKGIGAAADMAQMKWLIMGGVMTKIASQLQGQIGELVKEQEAYSNALVFAGNIVNANADAMRAMGEEIAKLPPILGSTTELMGGLGTVMTSGFRDAEEAMKVLVPSAEAAAGGFASIDTSVKAVTAVLNAYGMEASDSQRITDIMLRTVDIGRVTYGDFAKKIGNVVTIAADAGVEFEDLAAVLSVMTQRGMPVSQAMTAIRNMILKSIAPSEKAKKAFRALHVEWGAAAIESEGLVGYIQKVGEAVNFNTDALVALFPNIRAYKGFAATVSPAGLEDMRDALIELTNASGKSERNINRFKDSFGGAMKEIRAILDDMKQAFGEGLTPAVKALAGVLGAVHDTFMALPKPIRDAITTVGALSMGFVALTASIGATVVVAGWLYAQLGGAGLISALGAANAAAAEAAGSIGLFGTAAEGAVLISGGFVAAIAGLVVGGIALNNWIKDSNKLTAEYKESMNSATNETVLFSKAILEVSGYSSYKEFYEKTGMSVDEYGKKLREAKEAAKDLDELTGATLTPGQQELADAFDEVNEQMESDQQGSEALRGEYGRLIRLHQELAKEAKKDAEKALESYNNLQKEIKELGEKSVLSFADLVQAAADAGVSIDSLTDDTDLLTKAFAGDQQALSDLISEANMEQGLNSTIGDQMRKVKKDTDEATESYGDFKDVLPLPPGAENDVKDLKGEIVKLGGAADETHKAWEALEKTLDGALSKAFTSLMDGGDFGDAWEKLWKSFAKDAGKIVGDIMSETLIGAIEGGFDGAEWNLADSLENLTSGQKALLGIGGAGMAYQGYEQGNLMMGMMGGAAAGLAIGMNPALLAASWGTSAIIGPVVGAALGLISSLFGGGNETDKNANFYGGFAGGKAYYRLDRPVPGVSEKDITSSLDRAFRDITSGYMDILEYFQDPNVFSDLRLDNFTAIFSGHPKQEDIKRTVEDWVKYELPAQIWEQIGKSFYTGLWGADPTDGFGKFFQKVLADVSGLDIDTQLQEIAKAIKGIIDIINAVHDVSWENIQTQAALDSMGAFKQFMGDLGGSVENLIARMKAEISPGEAAADASRIAEYLQQGAQAILNMLKQIQAIEKQITDDVESRREALNLLGMSDEEKISYYTEQMSSLRRQMESASSPEEVQSLFQKYMKYYDEVFQLAQSMSESGVGSFRGLLDSLLNLGESASQGALAGMEDDLKKAADRLKEYGEEVGGYLVSLGETSGQTTTDIEKLGNAARDATRVFRAIADSGPRADDIGGRKMPIEDPNLNKSLMYEVISDAIIYGFMQVPPPIINVTFNGSMDSLMALIDTQIAVALNPALQDWG